MDLGFNELLSIALSLILCAFGLLIILRPKPLKTKTVQASDQASKRSIETKYTAEEVAKHKTRDDLWVIIRGKVYDFTSYVDEHPGGEAILNNAGGDTTEGFEG